MLEWSTHDHRPVGHLRPLARHAHHLLRSHRVRRLGQTHLGRARVAHPRQGPRGPRPDARHAPRHAPARHDRPHPARCRLRHRRARGRSRAARRARHRDRRLRPAHRHRPRAHPRRSRPRPHRFSGRRHGVPAPRPLRSRRRHGQPHPLPRHRYRRRRRRARAAHQHQHRLHHRARHPRAQARLGNRQALPPVGSLPRDRPHRAARARPHPRRCDARLAGGPQPPRRRSFYTSQALEWCRA